MPQVDTGSNVFIQDANGNIIADYNHTISGQWYMNNLTVANINVGTTVYTQNIQINGGVVSGGTSGKSGTTTHASGTWSMTFTNGILTALTT